MSWSNLKRPAGTQHELEFWPARPSTAARVCCEWPKRGGKGPEYGDVEDVLCGLKLPEYPSGKCVVECFVSKEDDTARCWSMTWTGYMGHRIPLCYSLLGKLTVFLSLAGCQENNGACCFSLLGKCWLTSDGEVVRTRVAAAVLPYSDLRHHQVAHCR